MNFKKLIQHYENMTRLQKAGGLRKELTPETCVQMYIQHYYENIDILETIEISNKVKYLFNEIQNIPF